MTFEPSETVWLNSIDCLASVLLLFFEISPLSFPALVIIHHGKAIIHKMCFNLYITPLICCLVLIIRLVIEEKTQEIKEEEDDAQKNQNQEQEQQLSLSAQAYKLFSDRKTPLEVAIAFNLRELEATKFYKEYWKLKQLHDLNMVYEELRGDIEPFLMLYKLAKRKGIGVKQVVNLLTIANNDLPELEKRFKRMRNDISMLQFQKRIYERNLYQLNNQIATTSRLLSSYRISCIRERREIGNLYNEKAIIENLVTQFKNNNEEFLNKIKQAAYEEVKGVLIDGKLLLKFATL
jgi:hypothetical protein